MKKLLTIGILITLVSCVSIPERRIIETRVDSEPKSLDIRDRKIDCVEKFHKLGKKHGNQLEACKFAFDEQ